MVGTAPRRAAGGQRILRDGRGTSPRTASTCALRPPCDPERAGVVAPQELQPGKPATPPPPPRELPLRDQAQCPVLRPVVAQGLRDSEVSRGCRSGYDTAQVHTPSSTESPPTPTHGNIGSHLARRGAACATFGDTQGTGWSQPHLDAFLKLRPA